MTLFERISYLAKKQGLSVFDLAEKLNLSRNSIYSWKKSSPKAETLERVAEYFDVTTDYLLGRTDNPNSDNLEEDEITTFFRVNTEDLTESEKDQLREELKEYLEFMKSRLKNK
ncbi:MULTISPECIES: helix-turn-helix transcriptional regulator [unclassified Enterococcus]|uniref:helix-turn-helix domain-containing protein n=1 Tax=unclassified Enterococcus TaxID=2608891 RepID=UPI001C10850E|nr:MULTISPECIES: helix-turn-helix transcriptional regulator [unclassified Enterococcus]MBU5495814.1 helix-turn-helix domain-containing protein [Enterococcus sp. S171_ASV_20]MBU5517640.1 helix-turn-helix domain-containing protein [Enterococcus sp. S163_ASV_20]MBU5525769.1 helix-turn-helix domain-containing protein [Enterococcus sp. S159_ASV_20]MBU5553506.1 helix-turn-helix domain-containing protein [Enterococcus sp. S157_ASV_20]